MQTGKHSPPMIIFTIYTSLIVAFIVHKALHVPVKILTLVGAVASIIRLCGERKNEKN